MNVFGPVTWLFVNVFGPVTGKTDLQQTACVRNLPIAADVSISWQESIRGVLP